MSCPLDLYFGTLFSSVDDIANIELVQDNAASTAFTASRLAKESMVDTDMPHPPCRWESIPSRTVPSRGAADPEAHQVEQVLPGAKNSSYSYSLVQQGPPKLPTRSHDYLNKAASLPLSTLSLTSLAAWVRKAKCHDDRHLLHSEVCWPWHEDLPETDPSLMLV